MTRFLRLLGALAAAALACGCATMTPPAAIKMATPAASRPPPTIIDRRSPEAKVYRESDTSSSVSKFFGDDVLQPQFLVLAQHQIADVLPPHLANARLELRQADIGFWIPLGSMPGGLPYMPPSIPAGPAIIGALLGYGIVYGINRASAKEFAVAHIVLTIDDQSVPASEQVAIGKDVPAAEAAKQAVYLALAKLAERVAAFTPEEPNAPAPNTEPQ